ncbi:hypothetical protein [Brevibacterium aurantiacum]|uniref:Uncharacterized protein n=1 Tax=Brevibacterium aurantiacum TaxID=273384 RepID=A0A556CFR3_BREAU|nr:hypothetical protein [Brevibacterium aurantiacum]TSI16146.1 hypothetical protein FO013_11020 [Brevibacterium aurantiacum]
MTSADDVLSSRDYSEAIRKGHNEVWHSMFASFTTIALMSILIVFVAGAVEKLLAGSAVIDSNNPMTLVVSGFKVIVSMFSGYEGLQVVGVLATIAIAQTVSSRSLLGEVSELPQSDRVIEGTGPLEVKKASKLQRVVLIAVFFSVFMTSAIILFSVVMFTIGSFPAGSVSVILGVFLTFETVRFFAGYRDIGEFKRDVSGRRESAFKDWSRNYDPPSWMPRVWYLGFASCLILPFLHSLFLGYADAAFNVLIFTVFVSLLYFVVFIIVARGVVDINRSSRLMVRGLSTVLSVMFWLASTLAVLEFLGADHVASGSVVVVQLFAILCLTVIMLFRVWGETRWLVFKGFGTDYVRRLGSRSEREILLRVKGSWNESRRMLSFWAKIVVVAIAIVFVISIAIWDLPPKESVSFVILMLLGCPASFVARWSGMFEKLACFGGALLILIAASRLLYAMGPIGPTYSQICFTVMLMIFIVVCWDRQSYFAPFRAVLILLDSIVVRQLEEFESEQDRVNSASEGRINSAIS